MHCGIFEKLREIARRAGEGRRVDRRVEEGWTAPQERAPGCALVHVTSSDRGPDRTGAVEKSKGKSQGMWITRAGVSNQVK